MIMSISLGKWFITSQVAMVAEALAEIALRTLRCCFEILLLPPAVIRASIAARVIDAGPVLSHVDGRC